MTRSYFITVGTRTYRVRAHDLVAAQTKAAAIAAKGGIYR